MANTLIPAQPDTLQLPVHLDGSNGTNRARKNRAQLRADTDREAIRAWLARVADTPATLQSYRKEAERLWLWATLERGLPLSSLTHEDLLAYQHFLTDPQPAERWVLTKGRKPARHSPDWRPFAGPLSPASQRQSRVILNSLFNWLVTAGYLAGNPLALSRHRSKRTPPRITRYLEDQDWHCVMKAISLLPEGTLRETRTKARARWLFSVLYLTGMRISEISEQRMNAFFCRTDRDGTRRWWLEVTGKGGKTRLIPANQDVLDALGHYRMQYGLPPLPDNRDDRPLLMPLNGKNHPLTRSATHQILKAFFNEAARLAPVDIRPRLEVASAHWLRHTAGSRMANSRIDLRHVRDTLGHASLTTTSLYLHGEDDTRHDAINTGHRLDWPE